MIEIRKKSSSNYSSLSKLYICVIYMKYYVYNNTILYD